MSEPEPAVDVRSDAELLLAISGRRDRVAFDELHRRYEKEAYNLAKHLTGNRDRAAEAVQEAMLRVWLRASNFRPEGKARGWILRIVARESLRKAPKRSGEQMDEGSNLDNHAASESAGGEGIVKIVRDERMAVLRGAVESLPITYRRILALYYGAGLTQKEFGEELNVSQRTVSSRLEGALQRLRSKLTDSGIAAGAPLQGANSLMEAIIDGHTPPAHLADAVRSQLSTGIPHVSRIGWALSRRVRDAGGASRYWLPCVLFLAGAVGYWVIQEPKSSGDDGPAHRLTPVEQDKDTDIGSTSNSEKGNEILGYWNFDKGPAHDIALVDGTWAWEPPSERIPGRMRAPERVRVILPAPIPRCPMEVWFRYRFIKAGTVNYDFVVTDGKVLSAVCAWGESGPTIRKNEYKSSFYFSENQSLLVRESSAARLAKRFDMKLSTESRICLEWQNLDIVEIGIRSLPEGRRIDLQRQINEVIEGDGVQMARRPESPLSLTPRGHSPR